MKILLPLFSFFAITLEVSAQVKQLNKPVVAFSDTVNYLYADTLYAEARDSYLKLYPGELSTNFTSMLMGAANGVNGKMADGQPGANALYQIRGASGIEQSNAMITVDGMPYYGNLSLLNPFSIESIRVDKSSTSFHVPLGLAANKVIAITTKKQSETDGWKVQLDVLSGFNTSALPKYRVIENGSEFLSLMWQGAYNTEKYLYGLSDEEARLSASQSWFGRWLGNGYNFYDGPSHTLINPQTGKMQQPFPEQYADDIGKIVNRIGAKQTYNVSLGKAFKRFSIYSNLGALIEQGYVRKTSFDRYSGLVKANYNPIENLNVGIIAQVTKAQSSLPNANNSNSNLFENSYTWAPIYPVYYRNAQGHKEADPFFGNNKFDWGSGNVIPGSSIGTRYEHPQLNPFGEHFYNSRKINDLQYFIQPYLKFHFLKNFESGFELNYLKNTQNTDLDFNDKYGQYGVGNLARGLKFNQKDMTSDMTGNAYLRYRLNKGKHYSVFQGGAWAGSQTFKNSFIGRPYDSTLSYFQGKSAYTYRNTSYYLLNQYNYDEQLFVHFKIAQEGFTDLNTKWNYAFGTAWDASRLIMHENIQKLKLKIDYGTVGYNKGNKLFNAGIESAFFDRKLEFAINYYKENYQSLLTLIIPPNIPIIWPYQVKNSGFEFELGTTLIQKKHIYWSSTINLTLPNSKLNFTNIGLDTLKVGNYLFANNSLYSFYMPESKGVNPETGDELFYYSYNGKDSTTSNLYNAIESSKVLGSAQPVLFGGWSNVLHFYRFDINMLWAFSFGGKYYDNAYQKLMDGTFGNKSTDLLNAWTVDNRDTEVPRFDFDNPNVPSYNSRFLMDASYLVLRNISLSYSFQDALTNRIKLSSLRISLSGENLWVKTKQRGMNPMGTFNGVYGFGYTPARTVMLGVHLGF